jgi:dipeptidase E
VKLLLTSGGVTTPGIRAALVELLGRPVEESTALCIPTAMYGHPSVGAGEKVWEFVSGRSPNPMVELGWRSVGLLELTAVPTIDRERWEPALRAADALLVSGGDALYLAHWLRESGVADLLPELTDTLWMGLSAGSMVLTPRIGDDFVGWRPPAGEGDHTLGLVDFCICPHLAPDGEPGNSLAEAQAWAATIDHPAYAMDDRSAIVVADGETRVVSDGQWVRFEPGSPVSS